MKAEALLRHYERVADAQDAIPRLRRFVFDIAVRGKLVEQDPADEPATALLERIANECASVSRPTPPSEAPNLTLPLGWCWTTFGAFVVHSESGWSPKTLDQPRAGDAWGVLKVSAVSWNEFRPDENKQVLPGTEPRLQAQVRRGDFLISRANTAELVARAVIVEVDPIRLMMSDKIVRLVLAKSCCLRYVWLVNNFADFARAHYARRASGVSPSMKNVTREAILELPIPLPPLAEQHRIVAKVDELMALCDRLEAARAEREAARDRLAAATLARLNAPDPETFAEDARFALDALPALAARPDQIKQLRQTILGLAVRGRLASQVATDAPAVELLAAIERRRSELLRSNYPNADEARAQIKKQSDQVVPPGLDALPPGWAWATLMQCSLLVVDCKNKTAPYASAGVRLVRTTNVRDGRLNSLEPKFVSPATYEVWSARCKPAAGDILITREAPMGEVCIIPEDETVCLGQRMMLIRLVEQTIEPAFMLYSLRDPNLMNRVQDKPIGATVQHLRVGGVETLLMPLPPLEEQRRIVARLDELMTLCDQLEANLAAVSGCRSGLMEALLREAMRPLSPLEEAA